MIIPIIIFLKNTFCIFFYELILHFESFRITGHVTFATRSGPKPDILQYLKITSPQTSGTLSNSSGFLSGNYFYLYILHILLYIHIKSQKFANFLFFKNLFVYKSTSPICYSKIVSNPSTYTRVYTVVELGNVLRSEIRHKPDHDI